MARYDILCLVCGKREIVAVMADAAEFMPCDICGRLRPQIIGVPYHVEDRTHMWKGPMGNGYSTALGEYMPDSRQARDTLAKKKGVEFISKAELLASNKEAKEAVEYHAEIKAGGQCADSRPDSSASSTWQAKPDWAKTLNV